MLERFLQLECAPSLGCLVSTCVFNRCVRKCNPNGSNRRNLLSVLLKVTVFLSPSILYSCHPSKRRLFRQRRWPAWEIQSGEGGVSLGPQQRLCGLRAQHQWQALSCRGERDSQPRRTGWLRLDSFLVKCYVHSWSFCKSNL